MLAACVFVYLLFIYKPWIQEGFEETYSKRYGHREAVKTKQAVKSHPEGGTYVKF